MAGVLLGIGLVLGSAPAVGRSRHGAKYVFDTALQAARAASAAATATPEIDQVLVSGSVVWVRGQATPAELQAGQTVTLVGSGFGGGPDVDFAKILIGDVRALERDLPMFQGAVALLQQLFYEKPNLFDQWSRDIVSWTDTQVVFRVPVTAHQGPLVVQVQKRTGQVVDLDNLSRSKIVEDPLTARVVGRYTHNTDVISVLGPARQSDPVPVNITNPGFQARQSLGEAIFWAYDYNMGLVHSLKGMQWPAVLAGQTRDLDGQPADPAKLFGAIPAKPGEVPDVALQPYHFQPYPIPMPLRPLFLPPLLSGTTQPTGWVGFVYAQARNPITEMEGSWIGMNCASCHAQRIVYEAAPGQTVARVFPGIPNPNWSMKWNVLGGMSTVKGFEWGPDGSLAFVDKTQVIWAVPPGTGEHTLIRPSRDGSPYANDYLFSPSAIPIITRHTPVRRALSHSDMIAGFEGSYIHSEEPDGAIGAMASGPLQALTTYLSGLDANDAVLDNLGVYRWLNTNGLSALVDGVGEGAFLARGYAGFPKLQGHLDRGRGIFQNECASCHATNFGTYSDENLFSFRDVGTYFSPTMYQMRHHAIRTAILRNLYWVAARGLLHDGHVKSLEDLVNPDRCDESSALYQRYYTLNSGTFHIPKGNADQERALRRFPYFVDVAWDASSLYWDFQTMRQSFGPRELGTPAPIPLPATPHPWCAQSADEIQDLVMYLLTL